MIYTTGMCAHCGADSGLHHFETEQCPKHGIEETRKGFSQQWEETTFEDGGLKRLRDAAPTMLEALQSLIAGEWAIHSNHDNVIWLDILTKAKAAIGKATGKK